MIVLAAILILREAAFSLFAPQPIGAPVEGAAIVLAATALNGWWAWMLVTRGRLQKSPALVADGKHLATDVVSSVGVVAGIGLAMLTGWWILDPLLAALVAGNILWSGSKVIKESLSGLMDEAPPEETLQRMRDIIQTQADGAVEAHDLRSRHAGAVTFIDFHLVVPGDMTVFHAYEICDRIEAALQSEIEGARITIHVEPEHMSKPAHSGVIVMD